MTGAGVVQSASTIGFETLYAGYRWDNPAPQMYYVRNRFLLPQVGTWNKRDPLGYVDGIALYSIVHCSPLALTDYMGLFDGGATVVIGGGIAAGGSTLVTTSTAGGIAGTTLVGGGSGIVYATTTATTSTVIITGTGTGAAGVAGTGTLAGGGGIATVAGGGVAATTGIAVAGAVVIAGAAYGTYMVVDPIWEWWFWEDPLPPIPGKSTGLQPKCGPTGATGPSTGGGSSAGTDPSRRETCKKRFVDHKDCTDLPDRYIYNGHLDAFAEVKRQDGNNGIKIDKERTAVDGPCPLVGKHYAVRFGSRYIASIVCCPCCEDEMVGPKVKILCGIVWKGD